MTVTFPAFSAEAPEGAVIGIVGDQASPPSEGRLLVMDHTLAHADALARAQAAVSLNRLRASGSTVLLFSHEPALLRELCDEVWWIEGGKVAAKGDPRQILDAYHARVAEKFRAWGETQKITLAPAMRRGDGRAEIVSLETIGSNGKPTIALQSGELAVVRVVVRFREAVENPVIGIMIRTRIGLEVYGTNTELEKLIIGPREAGQTIRVDFGFRCELCPKEYTLTAASHDPDGTAHDWVEDAVAFVVADSHYTAGVANLHATATWHML
ncbi:MAG: Wzt carbohydrate-binding domain-containing protein [Bryobacteraceae bacterium]